MMASTFFIGHLGFRGGARTPWQTAACGRRLGEVEDLRGAGHVGLPFEPCEAGKQLCDSSTGPGRRRADPPLGEACHGGGSEHGADHGGRPTDRFEPLFSPHGAVRREGEGLVEARPGGVQLVDGRAARLAGTAGRRGRRWWRTRSSWRHLAAVRCACTIRTGLGADECSARTRGLGPRAARPLPPRRPCRRRVAESGHTEAGNGRPRRAACPDRRPWPGGTARTAGIHCRGNGQLEGRHAGKRGVRSDPGWHVACSPVEWACTTSNLGRRLRAPPPHESRRTPRSTRR